MDKLVEYIQVLLEQLGLDTIEASFYMINIVVFALLFRYFLNVYKERQFFEDECRLNKYEALNNFLLEYKLFKDDNTRTTEIAEAIYSVNPYISKKDSELICGKNISNNTDFQSIYDVLKSHYDSARSYNKITHILNNHDSVFGAFESFFRTNGIIQLAMAFFYSLCSWLAIASVYLITYRFTELSVVSKVLLIGMILLGIIYLMLLIFILDAIAYRGVRIKPAYVICIVISILAPYAAAFENWISFVIYGGAFIFLIIMTVYTKRTIAALP